MLGNHVENLLISKSNAPNAQRLVTPSGVLIRCPLPSDGVEDASPRPRVKVTAAGLLRQRGKERDSHLPLEGRYLG